MAGILEVRLGERLVGTLANLPGDANLFIFAEEYADDPNRPVLSQGLIDDDGSLRQPRQVRRVAPPFFANLLPEDRSPLRAFLARQHQLNPNRDFPFLRVLGGDLPGNVIVTDAAAPVARDDGGARDAELDGDLAKAAGEMPRMRFSLAGVQMKFSASMKNDRLTLPASGAGGDWIVKLPSERYPYLTHNEATTMAIARDLGLNVPATRLTPMHEIEGIPEGLQHLGPAFAIERFDRFASDRRVHFEDFCQVAGLPPAGKYEEKTMEWVWGAFARLCPPQDIDELVRRFVFGAIVGNDDMHLKNWAVVYPDGRSARIAPLYDFLPTRRYTQGRTMALAIGGDNRWARLSWESLVTCARTADVRVRRVLAAAAETIGAFRERWPNMRDRFEDPQAVNTIEHQLRNVPLLRTGPPRIS
ncbi:MAG TPA: HipA domain-containing protein [Candidatus Baltobacteraceae bacterium]